MSYIDTRRRSTSGGGGRQTLASALDGLGQTDPFVSGFTIDLSEIPLDVDSLIVYFQTIPLDTDDYNYLPGTNQIEILFSGDPAIENPDTGILLFRIQYPYAT